MTTEPAHIPYVPLGARGRHGSAAAAEPTEHTDPIPPAGSHRASPAPTGTEMPTGAAAAIDIRSLDVQYDPDDPSDAVLAVTYQLGDAVGVCEYPLTSVKAGMLRGALRTQEMAVQQARHTMLGEPAEVWEPVDAEHAEAYVAGSTDEADGAGGERIADDDDADADLDDDSRLDRAARTARRAARFSKDPMGLGQMVPVALEEAHDIKGVSAATIVMWVVIGLLALAFIAGLIKGLA